MQLKIEIQIEIQYALFMKLQSGMYNQRPRENAFY